jgi:diaminohydroxyphosphoribosylaminopyrimidine deaminase/5-amino-6-(5-phosphoribosylamino)uracil reductase
MARHGQGKHWFTGPQAGEYTHYLRAGYDAILVGANTLAMDNPRLNVRHKNFPHQRNKLVILDPMGSAFREDLNIFSDHRREEVFWVVSPTIDEQKIMERAQTLICGIDAHGYFKLDILLETLFEKGIRSIFLEGGSHVYGSFLNQSMVDRLYVYTSPQVGWGGGHGESVYWTQSVKADVPLKLQNICQLSLGEDLLTTGRITPLGE